MKKVNILGGATCPWRWCSFSVKPVLFLRDGGAKTPCKWCWASGIYRDFQQLCRERDPPVCHRAKELAFFWYRQGCEIQRDYLQPDWNGKGKWSWAIRLPHARLDGYAVHGQTVFQQRAWEPYAVERGTERVHRKQNKTGTVNRRLRMTYKTQALGFMLRACVVSDGMVVKRLQKSYPKHKKSDSSLLLQ